MNMLIFVIEVTLNNEIENTSYSINPVIFI